MHDDLLAALLITARSDVFSKLRACEGEVVIRPGAVHVVTGGLEIDRTRYYTRTQSGALVEREPIYGSPAFVAWAQRQVSLGQFPEQVTRWCEELRGRAAYGMDLRLLDPEHAMAAPMRAEEAFVGAVGEEDPLLRSARRGW